MTDITRRGLDRAIGQPVHPIGGGAMLPVLGYGEASGLGRILRNRLRPLFEPEAADRSLAGMSVVFTAHNGILLKTMALEGRGVAWLPMTQVAESVWRLVSGGVTRPPGWKHPAE